MDQKNKYVIIDTDCGVDDALALMLALDCHKKGLNEILAITCVYGNCSVDKVVKNVFRTLNVCGVQNIKVFKGCESPLMNENGFEDGFMGDDGLGNSSTDGTDVQIQVENEGAVSAMTRLAKQYPNQITMVALGPLTNLALANHLDPEFLSNLGQIISMGGVLNGMGNVWPTTEFNYFNDPEAVHKVLINSKCPITIIPWDTCMTHVMTWDSFDRLVTKGTKKSTFIANIYKEITEDHIYGRKEKEGIVLCDILVVITALFPQLIRECNEYPTSIELTGQLTRGQLVVDRFPRIKPFPASRNVQFVSTLDINESIKLIQQMTDN